MGQDCRTLGGAVAPREAKLPVVLPVAGPQGSQEGISAPHERRGLSAYEGQAMFNHHKVEIEWGGRLILETGKIARQADGAVLATYGETVVLATVVSMKEPKPGLDFFPLTVNYQERPMPPARFRAAISSAKAARARRRRWFRASSTARSARCSPTATRTTRRSSSPSSSMTSRTIPTSCRSSPPRPR